MRYTIYVVIMFLIGTCINTLLIYDTVNKKQYFGKATWYNKGRFRSGEQFIGKGFVVASHNYLMPRGSKWKITNYDTGISTIAVVIDSVADSEVLVDCSLELAEYLGFSKLLLCSETKARDYKAKGKLVIQIKGKWYVESKNGSCYCGVEK